MPHPRLSALVLISLLLTACAGPDGERRFRLLPGVHRFPIQQGNIVTQDMIDQLQPGMTRAQVRYVLGTPLIADTFDQSRWDYLYTLRQPSGKRLREHVTIHFDDDRLVGIKAAMQLSERPRVRTLSIQSTLLTMQLKRNVEGH